MLERLRSLLRLLFVWKRDTAPDLPGTFGSNPDCIIVLAFGQAYKPVGLRAGLETSKIVPGIPNEVLAEILLRHKRHAHYVLPPILAQWEITETWVVTIDKLPVYAALGERGLYRNTREILEEAKQLMDGQGWKSAVIVANPWHLPRCQWTAQKLGIEVIHDLDLTIDLEEIDGIWNQDVEVPDNQKQTTSLRKWLWYEFRARGYFWLKGWI